MSTAHGPPSTTSSQVIGTDDPQGCIVQTRSHVDEHAPLVRPAPAPRRPRRARGPPFARTSRVADDARLPREPRPGSRRPVARGRADVDGRGRALRRRSRHRLGGRPRRSRRRGPSCATTSRPTARRPRPASASCAHNRILSRSTRAWRESLRRIPRPPDPAVRWPRDRTDGDLPGARVVAPRVPAARLGRRRSARWPAERDAVILAHNYQLPEIQDVADHVGDSLGLSRVAAEVDASTIVFCGVHFMAETAKILSYDKTVLIPDERAGCSLAETITAEQLRAWKAEHPGAVVVSYVNTTAAVKAETDICCTSSNAVEVVALDPRGHRGPVLPRPVPRRPRAADHRSGQHAHLDGRVPRPRRHQRRRPQGPGRPRPDAELFIHPECGCATSAAVPRRRRCRARRSGRGSCRPAAWSTAAETRRRRRCSSPPRPACCTS